MKPNNIQKYRKPMKKTALKAWIKALRSGEYKQDQGALCTDDRRRGVGYCCLGVLVDVAVDAYWEADDHGNWGVRGSGALSHTVLTTNTELRTGFLTWEALDQVGLDNDDQMEMSYWNDKMGMSFDEIADALERKYADVLA